MNANEDPGAIRWIFLFLARTFFEICKNRNGCQGRQNYYCVNCDVAACNHCRSEHAGHRQMQIYRLSNQDAAPLTEISKYIDCTCIQPYVSNEKWVLALHPLPHAGSGKETPNSSCFTCYRSLKRPIYYDYCSIACKYKHDQGENSNSNNTGNSHRQAPPLIDNETNGETGESSMRRHRRKQSTPKRAPFF